MLVKKNKNEYGEHTFFSSPYLPINTLILIIQLQSGAKITKWNKD